MATAKQLRTIALSLEGTEEAPHFDRTAYRVARIYVTVAADGKTANFNFTPDQQLMKVETHPHGFSPIDNAWGAKGWTTAILAKLSNADLEDALTLAWGNAQKKARKR